MCFSVNGYMGDMWTGPQAEVAQHLSNQGLNLADWQPIGYEDNSFPLSGGVASGLAELENQRSQHPGKYVITAWSEGCIISTLYLKAQIAAGNTDCLGGTFYGNPYRAAGQWNPSGTAVGSVPDPGGAGVGGPRNNWRTPATIHHYCHGPNQPSYDGLGGVDQYTCCSTGEDGNIARIFFDFVLTQWTGALSDLVAFAEALTTDPPITLLAAVEAAFEWIRFFAGQTGPHTDYTSYAGATYLAGVCQAFLRGGT